MSIFKDSLASDIDSVFFNLDEFADTYVVDGKEISVVQDDDRILEQTDIAVSGLQKAEGSIFVKAKDLLRIPIAGDRMIINDKPWFVSFIINNIGVYEIRLSRNQQYL